MRICKKCNTEKSIKEFYTYYHSTQKKYRTRHICKVCEYQHKKEYKNSKKYLNSHQIDLNVPNFEPNIKIVPLPQNENIVPKNASNEENAEYKLCIKCEEILSIDEFYARRNVCRNCILIADKKYRDDRRSEQLLENGGNMRVPPKPGVYVDELQRKNTYEILTIIGWSYDADKDRFYKPGLKTVDNIWYNPKTGEPLIIENRNQYKKFMSEVTVETLPKLKAHRTSRNKQYASEELINNMLYDFFIKKMLRQEVADKYGVKLKMLEYYIRRVLHEIKK